MFLCVNTETWTVVVASYNAALNKCDIVVNIAHNCFV